VRAVRQGTGFQGFGFTYVTEDDEHKAKISIFAKKYYHLKFSYTLDPDSVAQASVYFWSFSAIR
jgi:hypothetical protein